MPESPAEARSRHTYQRDRPKRASATSSLLVVRGVHLLIMGRRAPQILCRLALPNAGTKHLIALAGSAAR